MKPVRDELNYEGVTIPIKYHMYRFVAEAFRDLEVLGILYNAADIDVDEIKAFSIGGISATTENEIYRISILSKRK